MRLPIALLVCLGCQQPSPVSPRPVGLPVPPSHEGLVLAGAPERAEYRVGERVVLRWTLTSETACEASEAAAAVLLISSMTRDGVAVAPQMVMSTIEDGGVPGMVRAGMGRVPRDLVMEAERAGDLHAALRTVAWSPSGRDVSSLWPIDAPGTYRLTATYAVPPAMPGLPTTACRGVSAPATVELRIVRGLGLAALLLLGLRRRRAVWLPALGMLLYLRTEAGAEIVNLGGEKAYAAAYAACVAKYKEGRSSANDPGGDPSGVWRTNDRPGPTTFIQPWPRGAESSSTDCTPGGGANIYWNPTDTKAYSDGAPRVPCATLYHELQHAADCRSIPDKRECDSTGIRTDEVKATFAENAFLAHIGGRPRTTYRGDDHVAHPLPPNGLDACTPGKKPKDNKGRDENCGSGSCGSSNGDPHLVTFDGHRYDAQLAGEVVLVRAGDALEIQARQQPYLDSTVVTINTVFAMRVGEDRVGFYLTPAGIAVHVGGAVAAVADTLRLRSGGVIEHYDADYGGAYRVSWPDGSAAWVTPISVFGLTLDAKLAAPLRGRATGLLGNFDGNPRDDVLDPAAVERWRVTAAGSLFDYRAGESTATFTDRRLPSRRVTDAELPNRDAARAICRAAGIVDPGALGDCALDVGLTGQVAFIDTAPRTAPRDVLEVGHNAIEGTLAPGTERVWTFTSERDQLVYIATTSPDCETSLWLTGPDGKALGHSITCADHGRVALSVAGDYTLRLQRTGAAAARFTVRVTTVPADQTFAIAVGTTRTGSLRIAGEEHRFTFEGTRGQAIDVRSTVTDCNLTLHIYDPAGSEFRINTPMCGHLGRVELPATGRYTIVIRGWRGHVGHYGFSVDRAR
ncbi:MAG TPA: VWD domain-containing protein [Kofleriaceae bacterium]|nr:VWD domain-containing protein [Kofleriaceae bacterium]